MMVSTASCVADSEASIAISITRIKFCVKRTKFFDGKERTIDVSFDKHLEKVKEYCLIIVSKLTLSKGKKKFSF